MQKVRVAIITTEEKIFEWAVGFEPPIHPPCWGRTWPQSLNEISSKMIQSRIYLCISQACPRERKSHGMERHNEDYRSHGNLRDKSHSFHPEIQIPSNFYPAHIAKFCKISFLHFQRLGFYGLALKICNIRVSH